MDHVLSMPFRTQVQVLICLSVVGLVSCTQRVAKEAVVQPSVAQEEVSEKITFLQTDGRSYVQYDTARSADPTAALVFDKNQTQEEALSNTLYINPKNYRWDTTDPQFNLVTFPQGSYAVMSTGILSTITTAADGAMQYKSSIGKKDSDGHFGYWTDRSGGFGKYTYVWVLPETFEIVKYESNRHGDWVVRNNTVAFYGQHVNDLAFTMTYRSRAAMTYEALRAAVDQSAVAVKQVREGVRVTIAATVLFPSGGAELSTEGQAALITIAETLRNRSGTTVAVEGHTDDSPISGPLAKMFPTNWELSAARAITVVKFLSSKGIAESTLEARALGATRPTAPNTEKDRHRNRRIELLVMDGSERKTANVGTN